MAATTALRPSKIMRQCNLSDPCLGAAAVVEGPELGGSGAARGTALGGEGAPASRAEAGAGAAGPAPGFPGSLQRVTPGPSSGMRGEALGGRMGTLERASARLNQLQGAPLGRVRARGEGASPWVTAWAAWTARPWARPGLRCGVLRALQSLS